MANQEKPNVNTVWASAAGPDGVTPVPAEKQALGYVDEIPFYDDFNGHMQLISQMLQHLNLEGVARWDAITEYPVNAWAKDPNGKVYKAKRVNTNKQPSLSSADWQVLSVDRETGVARFLAAANFTVPDNVYIITVDAVAGGGGGGGGGGDTGGAIGGGGGGGAGQSAFRVSFNVTPGTVIPVIVGPGGAGGNGGTAAVGAGITGTAGGQTRVGDFLTLTGGTAGGGGNTTTGAGGPGGVPGGSSGADGKTSGSGGDGGAGGGSPFGTAGGGGRAGRPTGIIGTVGYGHGAGGGGGGAAYGGLNGSGGAGRPGMPGLVVISW